VRISHSARGICIRRHKRGNGKGAGPAKWPGRPTQRDKLSEVWRAARTAVDCLRPDRSSTSHNPSCATATRRLVRRSSDGSLSLSADFLTSVLATVNPQICGYDPSRDERAEGCDRRSRRCHSATPPPPTLDRPATRGTHARACTSLRAPARSVPPARVAQPSAAVRQGTTGPQCCCNIPCPPAANV
jgi:hypothetical protein